MSVSIENANVFDGRRYLGLGRVVFSDGVILQVDTTAPNEAEGAKPGKAGNATLSHRQTQHDTSEAGGVKPSKAGNTALSHRQTQHAPSKAGNDSQTQPDEVINAEGKFLMPGLIDSHAHTYSNIDFLAKASSYGVTTMLEMGNRERRVTDLNRSHHEMCHVLSCYSIAAAPSSQLPERMHYSDEVIMHTPDEGREYVRRMVSS